MGRNITAKAELQDPSPLFLLWSLPRTILLPILVHFEAELQMPHCLLLTSLTIWDNLLHSTNIVVRWDDLKSSSSRACYSTPVAILQEHELAGKEKVHEPDAADRRHTWPPPQRINGFINTHKFLTCSAKALHSTCH